MAQPKLTPYTYDEFLEANATLAAALKQGDWEPSFIVGIGRGGLTPAVFLSHASGIPMLSIDYSSHVAAFGDALLADLAQRSRHGLKLLMIDDINDSGRTIHNIFVALEQAGAVRDNFRFAVLIDNVSSIATVDYRARTIDRRTLKDWFVFPWESVAPREDVIEDAHEVPERIA